MAKTKASTKKSTPDRTRKKNKSIPARLGKPKDIDLANLPDTETLIAEPKLDGLRGKIIVKRSGSCKAYTSNGLKVPNARYICKDIAKKVKGMAVVFDGEFFSKNWNETQSLVMTQKKHPKAKTHLGLRCFDAMPFNDWKMRKSMPLKARKKFLSRLLSRVCSVRLIGVPWEEITNDKKHITRHFKQMLHDGHEGGMYKLPDAEYPFKRSSVWLRWKPKNSIDAKVIAIKWGNEGKTGQMKGLIGSLECAFKKGKKTITFNCSGMEMEERKHLTKMYKRKQLIGKMVEVEHEGVTKFNKVRFPQFVRMRDDKDE